MSRRVSILFTLVLVFALAGVIFAQDPYEQTYFDNGLNGNLSVPVGSQFDAGTLYIINPGLTGSPISDCGSGSTGGPPLPTAPIASAAPLCTPQGVLCANIYVFDDTQEMVECCSCPVTANGLLVISIDDLTENPLTVSPFRGVIKLISSAPNPVCDPTDLSAVTPELRSFATHLQNAAFGGTHAGPVYSLTSDELSHAPLSTFEQRDLAQICSFVRYLGTGRGRCDDECNEPIGGD